MIDKILLKLFGYIDDFTDIIGNLLFPKPKKTTIPKYMDSINNPSLKIIYLKMDNFVFSIKFWSVCQHAIRFGSVCQHVTIFFTFKGPKQGTWTYKCAIPHKFPSPTKNLFDFDAFY